MSKIKTSDLKEGKMIDKPVYIDGKNLLVPPNIPVKQKDIDRLLRWEITEVETEGNVIKEISEPINLDDIKIEIAEITKSQESLFESWKSLLKEMVS